MLATGNLSAQEVFAHDFTDLTMGELEVFSRSGTNVWEATTWKNLEWFAQVSGEGDEGLTKTYMVTPELDLSESESPFLSFLTMGNNVKNSLHVYASNRYTGDPTTTRWQALSPNLSDGNWNPVGSGNVDLSKYAGDKIRIAWYYSEVDSPEPAATWQVTNIKVYSRSLFSAADWGHYETVFDGKSRVDWLGWLGTDVSIDWVYLFGYGWVLPYNSPTGEGEFIFYSPDEGWVHVYQDSFPMVYFYDYQEWDNLSNLTPPKYQPAPKLASNQILDTMKAVADWQLANPSNHQTDDWTHGAYFAGLTEWAKISTDDTYMNATLGFGETNNWELRSRKQFPTYSYHADDHAVGQMYLEMYRIFEDVEMIQNTTDHFDYIIANPSTSTLRTFGSSSTRWSWCDALFMAPPVLAKLSNITGDSKYLDFMNSEWWATTDYLYDTDDHLYYRDYRYFPGESIGLDPDGIKNFWSRGNGWVFGGLSLVLRDLPADHPDRADYETLFREMAEKLIEIQGNDGLWRSSLLNPVRYSPPEASGSAFFCFGLAYGINSGLLEAESYLEPVKKAWHGLTTCIHPDGMLGFIQPIGSQPGEVNYGLTEVYGTGAFLLAGSEVIKLAD
jgi:rhamnogalacturonyl hydrolase YesR